MQLICPSCHTPLPETPPGKGGVLTCSGCWAEVDISRAGTAAGRPRFVPEIDRSGDTVGGYLLEGRVGSGGMGTVYRARKSATTPAVAIKFLAPSLAAEPDVVARFRREITLLEKLDHPAIVRVLDHGEQDGVPWFAMELVESPVPGPQAAQLITPTGSAMKPVTMMAPDLRTRLQKGPLSLEEASRVFIRLLDALAHAHERGVVHRDLKPANVLIAPDGARLADFGIARIDNSNTTAATRLTETAAIIGTFPYMSPEQRSGSEIDRRSDLFSVGVMLYESLTGSLPQGAFSPASQSAGGIPTRVDAVIAKLLRPKASDRYADAREASIALSEALRVRPSMKPVFLAGGVALVLLVLVVPPLFWNSNAGAKKIAADSPPSSPSATPTSVLANSEPINNGFSGGALDNSEIFSKGTKSNAKPKAIPTESDEEKKRRLEKERKQAEFEKNLKVKSGNAPGEVSKTAFLKDATPAPTPNERKVAQGDDSSSSQQANAPVNFRNESNVVSQIQSQAATAPENTPLTLTCDPTTVYDKPTVQAKVLGTFKQGLAAERLKIYRRYGSLDSIGNGAGLPYPLLASLLAEAAAQVKSKSTPPPASIPQQAFEQQQTAPMELWYFVRVNEKLEGWVLSSCATVAPPQQVQKPTKRSKL